MAQRATQSKLSKEEIGKLFEEREGKEYNSNTVAFVQDLFLTFKTYGSLSEKQVKFLQENKDKTMPTVKLQPIKVDLSKGCSEKTLKIYNSIHEYFEKNGYITEKQLAFLTILSEFKQ